MAIMRAIMRLGPRKKARQFVARRLAALRNARELSQIQLAVKADFERTYVHAIEHERRGISIDSLDRLCEALGISLPDFFNDKVK